MWTACAQHLKDKVRGMELKGKKAGVLGFGKSGFAATRLLLNKGADVVIIDSKKEEDLKSEYMKFLKEKGLEFVHQNFLKDIVKDLDLLVVSPGVPKEVYGFVESSFDWSGEVIGELELAFRLSKKKNQVIGITGTNGKTTVTAMIGEILRCSGFKVFVGGNYGIPFSELVLRNEPVDKVVLEVSSFQLETAREFSPKIGLLLNISPDHLDRYSSEEEYAYFKYKMFSSQEERDYAVLGENLRFFEEFKNLIKGKKLFFGKGNMCTARLLGGYEFSLKLEEEEYYDFVGFKLFGEHNRLNLIASALSARLAGATREAVREIIRHFRGFPHRLEFVANIGGVYFVNDSKATNVDAVEKALESLQGSVVLLMGGIFKGGDLNKLKTLIKTKVKALILFGRDRFVFGEVLSEAKEVPTYYGTNLFEGVRIAANVAEPGDVVLLSPGGASFDEFSSYEERGEFFKKCVAEVAKKSLDLRGKAGWH